MISDRSVPNRELFLSNAHVLARAGHTQIAFNIRERDGNFEVAVPKWCDVA